MVTRTLTDAQSAQFANGMYDAFGVSCGGADGTTWSYYLWYRPPKVTSEGDRAFRYSRSTSGSYNLQPKSGWKELVITGNQINVRVPLFGGLTRDLCNQTTNFALPSECDKTCTKRNVGVSSYICACTRFFVPNWVDSTRFLKYLNGVATSSVAISRIRKYLPKMEEGTYPVYLNDLGQRRTPIYYPKRTLSK